MLRTSDEEMKWDGVYKGGELLFHSSFTDWQTYVLWMSSRKRWSWISAIISRGNLTFLVLILPNEDGIIPPASQELTDVKKNDDDMELTRCWCKSVPFPPSNAKNGTDIRNMSWWAWKSGLVAPGLARPLNLILMRCCEKIPPEALGGPSPLKADPRGPGRLHQDNDRTETAARPGCASQAPGAPRGGPRKQSSGSHSSFYQNSSGFNFFTPKLHIILPLQKRALLLKQNKTLKPLAQGSEIGTGRLEFYF